MSDFLLVRSAVPPDRPRAALERFLAPVSDAFDSHPGPWGTLVVARRAGEPTVVDDGRVLTVLVGDPVVRAGGLPPAVVGAPGRREALHRAVVGALGADLREVPELLDGAFALLVLDREEPAAVRIVTDRFAFVTVTAGRGGWGTHVDALAHAVGAGDDLDLVSAADFLRHLTIAHPWTLYRGIVQLAPGTVHRFEDGAPRGGEKASRATAYWAPRETDRFGGFEEAARELRDAIAESAEDGTRECGEVGILLSGGEDSRVVLGALPAGVRATGFTYAEWESREVRTARAAARAHGAGFRLGVRSPDHYPAGFPVTASLVGSLDLFVDVHGYGLHRALGLPDLPVVLGGLSADSYLKATYAPVRKRTEGGKRAWDPGLLRPDLLTEAAERRRAFRDALAELRPRSADEWTVLRPFSMRTHGGNMAGNRRLFRSWEVFHSTRVLEVASAAPQEWKVGRKLYARAVRPFLARTRFLPHASNTSFPALPRGANALLALPLWVARNGAALARGDLRKRHRPWPKWSAVAGSPLLRDPAVVPPLADSPLREVFTAGPEAAARDVEGWYALRKLACAQLLRVTRLASSIPAS